MKVLYISRPPYFDLDLSLIKHLSKNCDIYYLMDLPPYFLKSSALNLKSQMQHGKIYNGKEFRELHNFKKYFGLKKFHVINRPSKKVGSRSNIKLQLKVVKFIQDLNPDVIHCNDFLGLNFLYFLFVNKRKIILTIHDPFPHSGESSFKNNIIRKLNYHFIKNIILLNNYQKNSFIKKNIRYKFKNVFNSSLGIYEYLQDYKITPKPLPNKFKILFFGRISKYKGIDDLLSVFSELEKEDNNVELIIAGSGTFWFDKSQYEKNPKITFINRFIPNEELVNLIANSTIVVCPYKDATQSGVIMSAFALNKPVLATQVGGLGEMIDDCKTGFMIPSNNSEALYLKLKDLIHNRELLKDMESKIKKEFSHGKRSWNEISKDLVKLYTRIE